MDRTQVQSIDQGLFAFPRPMLRHIVGYTISFCFFLAAFGLYSDSLTIPDVPRVEEATVLYHLHEDISNYEFGPLQDGYDDLEYASEAAFVVVPLELIAGEIASDDCSWVEDDEGNGNWEYSFSMAGAQRLTMVDSLGTEIEAAFSLKGSLSPEGEVDQPSCNSDWSRSIYGYGLNDERNFKFNAFVMVEENPVRYQLLSVTEIYSFTNSGEAPQEVTQREDRGRWALLCSGLGGLAFMYSTTPPLLHELRKIRKGNKSATKDITSQP
ncbi:MAG: hypothetical protein DWC05_07815, partial [Candidatus Poseidoniales archaeon]